MSITVDRLLRAYERRTRVGLGNLTSLSRRTSPPLIDALDYMRERDMEVLESMPTRGLTTATITTVSGQAEYTDITDLHSRRVRSVRLKSSATSVDSETLDYLDYDEIQYRFPEWKDGISSGGTRQRPTDWTIVPGTSTLALIPVPASVYTVEVEYEQDPGLYGLGEDVRWFASNVQLVGQTQFSDFDNFSPDRARGVNIFIVGANIPAGAPGTYEIVITGFSADGVQRINTIDITGFEAGVDVGASTSFYDTLTSLALPDLADQPTIPTINVGTSDTFDTVNIGDTVRITSLIPDDVWAERLGPVGGASDYFYDLGEVDDGNRMRAEFEKNKAEYQRAQSNPPQGKVFIFGSGLSGGLGQFGSRNILRS